MDWMGWTFMAVLTKSIETVAHRFLLANTDRGSNWAYMIGYNIGALLLLLFFNITSFPSFENLTKVLLLLACSGVFWLMLSLFSFKADQYADVSVTSIISQFQLVPIAIGGFIFLSEQASINKFIGIFLIIAGNIFIFPGSQKSYNWDNIKKGILFKMISVFALSIAILIDKYLSKTINASLIAISGYLVPTLFATVLRPSCVVKSIDIFKSTKGLNVVLGTIGCFSYYSLIRAFQISDISTVYPIYKIYVLFTVFLGIIILKEKEMVRRKVLAALIVVIGSMIIL